MNTKTIHFETYHMRDNGDLSQDEMFKDYPKMIITTKDQVDKFATALANSYKWQDESIKNVIKNLKLEAKEQKITWEQAFKELIDYL